LRIEEWEVGQLNLELFDALLDRHLESALPPPDALRRRCRGRALENASPFGTADRKHVVRRSILFRTARLKSTEQSLLRISTSKSKILTADHGCVVRERLIKTNWRRSLGSLCSLNSRQRPARLFAGMSKASYASKQSLEGNRRGFQTKWEARLTRLSVQSASLIAALRRREPG